MKKISVDIFVPDNSSTRVLYRLIEDLDFDHHKITVPKGFISDGATVPKFVRGFFPSVHQYFPAAILHDYLIFSNRKKGKISVETRKWIDKKFYEEMRHLGVSKPRSKTLYLGVRVYAFFKYTLLGL